MVSVVQFILYFSMEQVYNRQFSHHYHYNILTNSKDSSLLLYFYKVRSSTSSAIYLRQTSHFVHLQNPPFMNRERSARLLKDKRLLALGHRPCGQALDDGRLGLYPF